MAGQHVDGARVDLHLRHLPAQLHELYTHTYNTHTDTYIDRFTHTVGQEAAAAMAAYPPRNRPAPTAGMAGKNTGVNRVSAVRSGSG